MPAIVIPDIDLDPIADAGLCRAIRALLALVERLAGQVRTLQEETQRLRAEVSRLQGEPGRPVIRPQAPPPAAHSSERERRQSTPRQGTPKREHLVIDRTETLAVGPATLPPDAERKGDEEVVVQDIVLHPDNVLFRKEQWHAAAAGKTYLAPLPPGYDGQFGAGLVTLVLTLYGAGTMSEAKIVDLLHSVGVLLSAGHVSDLLIKEREAFHAEWAPWSRPAWPAAPGSTSMTPARASTARPGPVTFYAAQPDLTRLLAGLTPIAEDTLLLGPATTAPLRVTGYLSAAVPPLALVTSVRALVLAGEAVLALPTPTATFILPGGRRESDEAPEATLRREVLEEAGWTLAGLTPMGFLRYHATGSRHLPPIYPLSNVNRYCRPHGMRDGCDG